MAKKVEVKNKVLEQGIHYLQSPFGKRKFAGKVSQHNGDDLTGKNGADWIVAIDDGVVTAYKYSETRGYYIEIKMANGYLTRYLHTKEGTCQVKVGQKIKKGQRLAYMGNTGYYTDANGKKHRVDTHLHFAVVDKAGNFVDPMPYLQGTKSFVKWKAGQFKVINNKYLRTSPEVKSNNKVKYKSLKNTNYNWPIITHADKLGYARMNSGIIMELTEFAVDSKGNTWGKCKTKSTPIWICVHDSTGDQVKVA